MTNETLQPWLGRCAHVKTDDGIIVGSISLYAANTAMIDILETPRSHGSSGPALSHKVPLAKIVEITAAS